MYFTNWWCFMYIYDYVRPFAVYRVHSHRTRTLKQIKWVFLCRTVFTLWMSGFFWKSHPSFEEPIFKTMHIAHQYWLLLSPMFHCNRNYLLCSSHMIDKIANYFHLAHECSTDWRYLVSTMHLVGSHLLCRQLFYNQYLSINNPTNIFL